MSFAECDPLRKRLRQRYCPRLSDSKAFCLAAGGWYEALDFGNALWDSVSLVLISGSNLVLSALFSKMEGP